MTFRWALGIAVLFAAACDDTCSEDKNYCDGNVAHFCSGGGDKGPLKWASRECEPELTCMKGQCLVPPVIACSTPDAQACFEDGQRVGVCRHFGYWTWEDRCDTTLGEVCLTGSTATMSWAACLLPSLGTCSEVARPMCHQNRALTCYAGYWRIVDLCDSALGEACQVSQDDNAPLWARCFWPDQEACSASDLPICRDNQVLECAAAGRWAMTRDCASEGLVCQNGTCVKTP